VERDGDGGVSEPLVIVRHNCLVPEVTADGGFCAAGNTRPAIVRGSARVMASVRISDIEMYYEVHGEGEPLILISGLNSDHTLYTRTGIATGLAQAFLVVVFDNRGVGAADKPDEPYSMEMMANDTAGLLDTLGIERAHVLGTSMGGRIAIALALEHPEHVASLVLVSSGARTAKTVVARRAVDLMLRLSVVRGEAPYHAVAHQRDASRAYDATGRLSEIAVPTLILHGRRGRVAPLALAEEMHARIRGSRMITYRGGHLFFIVRREEFVAATADILESVRS
jgi:3-oxoadipate enol-lactonase